ncbi:MAG: type II toxin-antitoxin system VapC family toxin [Deltaproteobacteria bacterium]|nr:type II toxin-antitoxin system VapC family toxin [Deltaproteobacteria bacterium]
MNEYFIDTNIFMYAAGKPHEFKQPCVDILSRIQSGELKAAIDTEVFQEILYDTTTSIFRTRELIWHGA